jgi:hypothetical protein
MALFFALKNLSTIATEPCVPWEVSLPVPDGCAEDKAARAKWMMNPLTNYNAYSSFEGLNSNQRINSKTGEEGNPPLYHTSLTLDIDFPLSEVEVRAAIDRMKIKPNWLERSLSNNWRMVWLFEKPVAMASFEFAVLWLSMLDQIIPFRQVAGIDEGAILDPARYYTNGCKWEHLHDTPVPYTLLLGLLQKVSQKHNWDGAADGVSIPLDIVKEELKKKYPRFAEWDGEFELKEQGPSFWVEGSVSPKSATVFATGMHTFAEHAAGKPFFNWTTLLGNDFVKTFKFEEMGRAVNGIHFDGRSYIRQNEKGEWLWEDKESVCLHLRVARGLTDRRPKGMNYTQVDSALAMIKNNALISSAGSFAGYEKGIMHFNGNKYLNIHDKTAMTPSTETPKWGLDGNMPFLSHLFNQYFTTDDQLPFFFSWCHRFYKSVYLRDPCSGHALFVFGPPNRGKTFVSNVIIAALVGGSAEAKAFLMGEDSFNSELFDYSLWTIDDGSVGGNQRLLHQFAEMVKRVVANQSFRSNEKFRKAGLVKWQGRPYITGNVDAESLRQIPNLDISIKEKIMLFRVRDIRDDGFAFKEPAEMRKILARELPIFARYMLDWVIPEHCKSGDVRYGVQAYHEPTLLREANHSSSSGTFGEILDEFQREFFTVREPNATEWLGTALQLHKAILTDLTMVEAMRPYNVQAVSRMLSNLAVKKVFDIKIEGDEHRRLFRIKRDARYPLVTRGNLIGQGNGASRFQSK